MNYFILLIIPIAILSAVLVPSLAHAQNPLQFEVKDPNGPETYDVNYTIDGGTVSNITVEPKDSALLVSIETQRDGVLTITLPRQLIDAKTGDQDDLFFVLLDGELTDFDESKTDTDRTLKISFTDGTQTIDIVGTQVVPEFGSLSIVVFTIATIGIIAAASITRTKF